MSVPPIKAWIEAMRLRTLPVSVAGVTAGLAFAFHQGTLILVPAILCYLFAVLAQIASNFANEYFDYKNGFDTAERRGPRRGVSCGDITPRAMLRAVFLTLLIAGIVGCAMLFYGPLWLLPAGIGIALGAMSYSAGPYPLSRHCLGEVAVIVFFGVVPVNLTFFLQTGEFSSVVMVGSLSIGLMGSMVLIANNYRDIDEDRHTGKHTLATVMGRRATALLYLVCGLVAAALIFNYTLSCLLSALLAVGGFLTLLKSDLSTKACIKLLAITSVTMFVVSLLLFVNN